MGSEKARAEVTPSPTPPCAVCASRRRGIGARGAVKILEGPLTVEPGILARLVRRPDGTVEIEVLGAAGWESSAGRVSIRVFIDGIPAQPELLARLGVPS
jgi:hypothetical protein